MVRNRRPSWLPFYPCGVQFLELDEVSLRGGLAVRVHAPQAVQLAGRVLALVGARRLHVRHGALLRGVQLAQALRVAAMTVVAGEGGEGFCDAGGFGSRCVCYARVWTRMRTSPG